MSEQIFISYRRSDEPKARLLYVLLKERGVEAWYDAKITAGEDWRNATARALDAAPIFVLLLSKNAADSSDINKELAAATHKNKLIVPVRLENIQLEGAFLYELAARNWIDAYDKPEMRLAELADKLARLVNSDMDPGAAEQLQLEGHLLPPGGRKTRKRSTPVENQLDRGKPERRSPKALIASAAAAVGILAIGTFAAGLFMMQQNAPAVAASGGAVASGPAAGANVAVAGAQPADASAGGETLAGGVLVPAAEVAAAAPAVMQADIEAARTQIAQYDDTVLSNVRADLKSAAAEYKAAGGKVSSKLATQISDADAAHAAIRAAREAAKGTDGAAIIAASQRAAKAMTTANDLRPVAAQAVLDAKRYAFGAAATGARAAAAEMAQLASVKKPGAFASGERKDAWKFLQDNTTWANARLAELDGPSATIATADRKTATRDAAAAAALRGELETALANSKGVAATLAK